MIDTYQNKANKISSFEVVYASDLQQDDLLIIADITNQTGLKLAKVGKVETRVFSGLYAPLTAQGNLVVDNVLVSCYAVHYSHTLSHLAFAPIRLWNNILDTLPSLAALERFKSADVNGFDDLDENGIHWYAKGLHSMVDKIMPSQLARR